MVEIKDVDDLCDIVMRQTNYSKEISLQKLEELNFDVEMVIRDYMKPKKKKQPKLKSLNQRIYKEIRFLLDKEIEK